MLLLRRFLSRGGVSSHPALFRRRTGLLAGAASASALALASPVHAQTSHAFGGAFDLTYVITGDGGPLVFRNPVTIALSHNAAGPTFAPVAIDGAPAGTFFGAVGSVTVADAIAAIGGDTAIAAGNGEGDAVAAVYFAGTGTTPATPGTTSAGSATAAATTDDTLQTSEANATANASANATLTGPGFVFAAGNEVDVATGVTGAWSSPPSQNFPPVDGSRSYWHGSSAGSIDLAFDVTDPLVLVDGMEIVARAGGDVSFDGRFAAPGSGISTFVGGLPAFVAVTDAGGSADFRLRLAGTSSLIATAGAEAPALLVDFGAVGDSTVLAALDGDESAIATAGANAPAAWLTARSSTAVASSELQLAGEDAAVATAGEGSQAVVLNAAGLTGADAVLALGGAGASVSTAGLDAAAALLVASSQGRARTTVALDGRGSAISTSGEGSAGIVAFASGTSSSETTLALGPAASIATEGANAPAAMLLAGEGASGSARVTALLGEGSMVTTTGADSAALIMHGWGATAALDLELRGAGSRIGTSGDGAPAATLLDSSDTGTVSVDLSGREAGIATGGERAPGLIVMSRTDGAIDIALSGAGSFITTAGAESNALVVAGDGARIALTGAGARIGTEGADSSALILAGDRSDILVARSTSIVAEGSGSAGIRFLEDGFGHVVVNGGTIAGLSGGIFGGAGISVANRSGGLIASGGGDAVSTAFGTIDNRGEIAGLGGIVFTRAVAGDGSIVNGGMIRSIAGPAGVAIDMQGLGDDTFRMRQSGLVIGTIALGDGTDRFVVDPGTNLRFTFAELPEEIDAGTRPVFINGTQVTVVDPAGLDPLAWLALDLGATLPVDGSRLASAPAGTRIWADGMHTAFGSGDVDDLAGSDRSLNLARLGVDFSPADDFSAGLFAGVTGYGHRVGLRSQDNDSEAFLGGVEVLKRFGAARVGGGAVIGRGSADLERRIANNTLETGIEDASAETDAWFGLAGVHLAWDMALGAATLTPILDARIASIGGVSSLETGDAGIGYDRDAATVGSIGIGARLARDVDLGSGVTLPVALDARLSVQGLLAGGDGSVAFGGETRAIEGGDPFASRVALGLGVSADHAIASGSTLSARLGFHADTLDTFAVSAQARFSHRF